MAWSKSTRITIMLAIDTAFFILELGVGLAVGSLALMADAFHMLNDIISLVVGLWAVKASQRSSTDKYSFGWLRAEILGAFFNAIFLIALCLTIVLEAITRLVDPPKILNPVLILIVGSLGLASNLAGFIVLGGHGHEHGAEEHDHDHGDDVRAAEEGHNHTHDGKSQRTSTVVAEDDGPIGDVFPEAVVAKAKARSGQHSRFSKSQDDAETKERPIGKMSSRAHKRRSSSRFTSVDDFSIHPASFRNDIIAASKPQLDGIESEENTSSETEEAIQEQDDGPTENSPLLKSTPRKKKGVSIDDHDHSHAHEHSHHDQDSAHAKHNHNKPRKASKGGHSHNHADMGMNAMILHVMGDALGNVGVIVSALIIWLTNWSGRFYADPAVSLFITLIILRSTIPLTSATAKILLQATPDHIDVNDIKEDIQDIPGVVSCHHVHIWQLSDTQVVASMHIQVAFPISEASGERYMELAKVARKCLHAYGIHSATLQPEFCLDKDHDHTDRPSVGFDGFDGQTRSQIGNDECLLECVDDCEGRGCCAPTAAEPEHTHSSHDGHSH